jgi:integrase
MASIRKREGKKGVSWIVDYTDPDGRRKRKSFKMKKDAVSYRNRVGVDMDQGTYVDPNHYKKQTLRMLLEDYEKNFKHQRGWERSKRYHMDVIRNHFGEDTRLINISYKQLEEFRNTLKSTATIHNTPRTDAAVNRCMSALRHMFRKALSWNMMKASPFNAGESLHLKENNERDRFLSEDEIQRLLDECQPYLRDIVECALHTGMRRGEVLSLKWDQIRNGYIYLRKTKNNRRREIPINDDLTELFKKIRQRQHLTSEYVFTCPQGRQLKYVKTAYKAALKRAGILDANFHTLRHSFASHFCMRTGDLKALQEILGHRSIKTTMRYSHLIPGHKQKAINAMAGLTSKNGTSQNVPNWKKSSISQ